METLPRPRPPVVLRDFAPIPELDMVAYERIAREVHLLLGIDLSRYRPTQVWRRVNGFAAARGMLDADELVLRVRQDVALRQAFLDMLTINVSEFFRNPEAWDALAEQHLRPMFRSQAPVRIWSAGCSVGFEPFTIAMLTREIAPFAGVEILATDVDETSLSKARKATFTEAQMAGVSPTRQRRFFRRMDGKWQVRPEIQAPVTFRRQDLVTDPCEGPFDIVVCRNVVIYFTEQAKTDLYGRFHDCLRPGGILFLGATEAIPNARTFGLLPAGSTFYKRP
jgi:chemotaxis protein methyltransferase CheR